jgi:hypothetical protein
VFGFRLASGHVVTTRAAASEPTGRVPVVRG